MTAHPQITWQQLAAQIPATTGERSAYATQSPQQFGVLRVPPGAGPHPVAIVIHGGCWLAEFDHRYVETLAESLTVRGAATWVLEYRRIGNDGGGWPGTFLDVARGADHLRTLAAEHALDLNRVVAVGHSAGGHLALWLAARAKLPAGSELFIPGPLHISGVVALAGIGDLRSYALSSGTCNEAVPQLIGGTPDGVSARYGDASPWDLLPLGVPLRFVHGAQDGIVPVEQSRRFADAERRHQSDVEVSVLKNAGHFDVVAPSAQAGLIVAKQILDLLESRR